MEIDLANLPAQPAEGEANIEGGVKLCIRMGKKPALSAKARHGHLGPQGRMLQDGGGKPGCSSCFTGIGLVVS